MTNEDILAKYDETVASFAASLASGLMGKWGEQTTREQYELFKAGRDAVKEKMEREKGCEHCLATYTKDDWGEGGAHDFRIHDGVLYYYDQQFGWEGTKVKFCPHCGRRLRDGHRAEQG